MIFVYNVGMVPKGVLLRVTALSSAPELVYSKDEAGLDSGVLLCLARSSALYCCQSYYRQATSTVRRRR